MQLRHVKLLAVPILVLGSLAVVVPVGSQDLAVYRAGALDVLHGRTLYGPAFATQTLHHLPFTYPPFAALAAIPLTTLPESMWGSVWAVLTVVVLGGCVLLTFRPALSRFGTARPARLALVIGLALLTTPVRDHLHDGQIDLLLMSLCLVDCVAADPPWPRGLLVGFAAAIKLVPLVFLPYFWIIGRRRAALIGAATFGAATLVGGLAAPHDSWEYWRHLVFQTQRIGDNAYFSNQSWHGVVMRSVTGSLQSPTFAAGLLAIIVIGYANAHRLYPHNELASATIVGLLGVLAAPVSWIHSMVWMIPAVGVLLGSGDDGVQACSGVLLVASMLIPAQLLRTEPFSSMLAVAAFIAMLSLSRLTARSPVRATET